MMTVLYKVVDNGGKFLYVTAEGWEHFRIPIKCDDAAIKPQMIEAAKNALFMKLKSFWNEAGK